MKRKLFLLSFLFGLAVTFFCSASNSLSSTRGLADTTYSWTPTTTAEANKLSGTSGNALLGDIQWSFNRSNGTYTGLSNPVAAQVGSSKNQTTLTLSATLPINYGNSIKSISITSASASGASKLSVSVGEVSLLSSVSTGSWTTFNTKTASLESSDILNTISISFTSGTIYLKNITIIGETKSTKSITSLEVLEPATKTNYYVGQLFVNDGLVLKATYSDASENLNYMDYSILPSRPLENHDETITFVSNEDDSISTSIPITVIERTITGIRLTNLPTKMDYYQGESLQLQGLIIEVTYNLGEPTFVGPFSSNEEYVNLTTTPSVSKVLAPEDSGVVNISYLGETILSAFSINVYEAPYAIDLTTENEQLKGSYGSKAWNLELNGKYYSFSGSYALVEGFMQMRSSRGSYIANETYLGMITRVEVTYNTYSASSFSMFYGNSTVPTVNSLSSENISENTSTKTVTYTFPTTTGIGFFNLKSADDSYKQLFSIGVYFAPHGESQAIANGLGVEGTVDCTTISLATATDLFNRYYAMPEEERAYFSSTYEEQHQRLLLLQAKYNLSNPLGSSDSLHMNASSNQELNIILLISIIGLTTLAGFFYIKKRQLD